MGMAAHFLWSLLNICHQALPGYGLAGARARGPAGLGPRTTFLWLAPRQPPGTHSLLSVQTAETHRRARSRPDIAFCLAAFTLQGKVSRAV